MGSKTRLPLGKWLSSRFALDLGRFLTLVKVGLCLDCGDSGGRDLFAPLVNSVFMRVIGYWIRDIVVLYIYHLYIYIYIYIYTFFSSFGSDGDIDYCVSSRNPENRSK